MALLKTEDFTPVLLLLTDNEPNAAYDALINIITKAYNKAFSLIGFVKSNCRTLKNCSITKGLLKSYNKKNNLYLKYTENPSEINKHEFIVFRNKFKSIKNKAVQKSSLHYG